MNDATRAWSGTNPDPSLLKQIQAATEQFKLMAKAVREVTAHLGPIRYPERDAWVINQSVRQVATSWKTAWFQSKARQHGK